MRWRWPRVLARKRMGLVDGQGDWWERIGADEYAYLGRDSGCNLVRSREHLEHLYPPVVEAQR